MDLLLAANNQATRRIFFPSNARWLSPGRLSSRKDNSILQQSSHQTQRNNKVLTSSGFKQQPICTPLAPTRNKIIHKTACSDGPNSGSGKPSQNRLRSKGASLVALCCIHWMTMILEKCLNSKSCVAIALALPESLSGPVVPFFRDTTAANNLV